MGTDTPLAVLSSQHPPLFSYFKQRFAQVTNPPIDAIREKVVTSTSVYIGAHGNLLEDKPENCKVLKVHNPILTSTDLLKIKYMNVPGFKVATVSINYYKNTSLEKAIDRVFLEVDRAYKDGANIIILSDRDVDEYHVTIPSLLAVSAVSQYLIRTKKSTALASFWRAPNPGRCITLPPCWATVPAPSTPIWPMRPSASSSTRACWTRITMPPWRTTTTPSSTAS